MAKTSGELAAELERLSNIDLTLSVRGETNSEPARQLWQRICHVRGEYETALIVEAVHAGS